MAAVAASVRSLIHGIATLPSRSPTIHMVNNNHLTLLPVSRSSSLHETKTTLLLPPSPSFHRLHSLLPLAVSSSAAYTETDDEFIEEHGEEAGQEELEESQDGAEEQEQQQQQQPTRSRPRSSTPEEAGRLYVGNLPYSMTASQLSEIFSQAGTVDAVEIVYNRVTDRSRGFAFVTMSSAGEANEAIRMFDGSQLGGRTVKVNFPEVPRGGEREVMGPRARSISRSRGYVDSPHKVYAGNLGWTVTSEALRDAFGALPGLLGAKVIYELGTGRSRGYGFVSFTSSEEAMAAIKAMNGKEVEGRPLRLNLASERTSAAAAAPPPVTPSQASSWMEQAEDPESSSFQSSLT